MSKLTHRLDRLEAVAKKQHLGRCPLCYGHPIAFLYEIHAADPNGPGYLKTGEYFLLEDDDDRIDENACCIQCGAAAARVHLISSAEHAWRNGKRVWVD